MRLPFLTCSFFLLASSALTAQTSGGEVAEPVLIWTHNTKSVRTRHGAKLRQIREFRMLPLVVARLTATETRALASDPDIEHIQPDRKYYTSLLPAIPVAGIQPVWAAGYLGRNESVAFIDTGVQSSHSMFQGVHIESHIFLKSGVADPCFADDATSPEDLQGHGTRTASILAGQGIPQFANYFGAVRGVGTLYSMKAGFRSRPNQPGCQSLEGTLYGADIFDALEYIALNTSAKVVNLSIGAPAAGDDDGLAKVSDYVADAAGLTLVFSAGNAGNDAAVNTPGIAYNGITVANLDDRGTENKSDDIISPSSTRGPTPGFRNKPDLAAPGTRVYSADIATGALSVSTGTSVSAPIVAGAAVLLRDAGLRDPLAIKALLINSTDAQPEGWRRDSGWGLVNAATAFDQRWNLVSGSLPPRASQYFRGSLAGAMRTTLTWNRHIDTSSINANSPLNPLSLQIYQRDGTLVTRGDGARDNVVSLNVTSAGEYVVRVEAPSAAFARNLPSEDFAVAFSRSGLSPVAGPALSFRCSHDNPVRVNTVLNVTCTAENTGDLDLFGVTAVLAAPPGFTNGGPQSFGNLAPGATRSNTWSIGVPNTPSSYSWTASASASSYGSTVEAQAALSNLEVVAGSALILEPATVFLTAASPAARIGIAGGNARTATTSGGVWFQATLNGAAVTIALTDQSRDLAPGAYAGEFIVAGAEGTSRGRVTYTVKQPPPVVDSARITTGAIMQAGCPAPDAIASPVSDAVQDLQFWFVARNTTPADVLIVQWYSPAAGLTESVTLPGHAESGDFCYAAAFNPRRAGLWRADLIWNGTRRASIPFQVAPALQLASTGSCPSDAQALRVCAVWRGGPLPVEYEFVRPNGEVDGRARSDGSAVVEYTPLLPSAGEWLVRVKAGRAAVAELHLVVASAVTVRSAGIAAGASVFRYAIEGGQEGTSGLVEFVDPNGSSTILPLDAASGEAPVPESVVLGRWRVRLYWDGVVVHSSTFDRLPVTITSLTGPTALPVGVLEPAASFTECFDGAAPGDRVMMEFSRQKVVLARAAFDAFAEGGSWCSTAALPVSGAIGARQPGDWEFRATVNGVEVSRVPFAIQKPTAAAASSAYAPLDAAGFAPLVLKGEQSRP